MTRVIRFAITVFRPNLGIAASLAMCMAAIASPVFAASPLDGYANYESLAAQVKELDQYDAAEVKSLGVTSGGRDVWLIAVGLGDVHRKPALLVVGATHAPHLVGSELTLRMAKSLVDAAKSDPEIKSLLERRTFYFVPSPSPDASEKCFAAPLYAAATNGRGMDDDRDFATDEDGPQDLNGDGVITLMRVADPAGDLMLHPQEPRVLVAPDRNKGERGTHRVYVEGRDDDGDGLFQEDPLGGVAFDRNFTFQYPFFQSGAGPHQVSEPETRALADFCFERHNIAAVFSFSPEDNLYHTWKPDGGNEGQRIKTRLMSADAPTIERLAEAYRKEHAGQDAPAPVDGEGSFVEWAYFHYGRWSLAARGWWVPKVPLPEGSPALDGRGADELNLLRWLEREKIDGFVAWTPLAHPDFPGQQVDIGGFKPLVGLNPPAGELDGLAAKHLAFLKHWANSFPQLKLETPTVASLGSGVYRLKAIVVNEGAMPTMNEMGRVTGQPFPLQLRLTLPEGAKLLTGAKRTRLDPLPGNGGRVEKQWVIQVKDGQGAKLSIQVDSPYVGEARVDLAL